MTGSDRRHRLPVAAADLDPEDTKLVRLARVAQQRAYVLEAAGQGAAGRDTDGRTYAAATVEHPSPELTTSALRGVLSAALSSGARRFEAFVVLPEADDLDPADRVLLAEYAPGVPVLLADANGIVVGQVVVAPATGER